MSQQTVIREHLERLHLIASGDRDCDMSDNDLGALRAMLVEVERLNALAVDALTTGHGQGQEHAIADANAGLIDDLIAPRLDAARAEGRAKALAEYYCPHCDAHQQEVADLRAQLATAQQELERQRYQAVEMTSVALRAETERDNPTCEHCGLPLTCASKDAERIHGLEVMHAESMTRAEKAEAERDAIRAQTLAEVKALVNEAMDLLPSTRAGTLRWIIAKLDALATSTEPQTIETCGALNGSYGTGWTCLRPKGHTGAHAPTAEDQ